MDCTLFGTLEPHTGTETEAATYRITLSIAVLPELGLHKLRAFVDEQGLLRVGGRLLNANISYDEQNPVILGTSTPLALLIIRDAHERVFHAGPQHTSAQLHQRYWLLGERRAVRGYTHKCIVCIKARPRVQPQEMGNLPIVRVTATRAFLHTAIDYAGPIWSRTAKGRGHKAWKSWIAVFVCLVSDLSSAAFIAAFRRFTARISSVLIGSCVSSLLLV